MIKNIILASVDNKYKDSILDFIANDIEKSEKKRVCIQKDASKITFHIPFYNNRSWSPFCLYWDGTIYISDADGSSFFLKSDVKFPNGMFYHFIIMLIFLSLGTIFMGPPPYKVGLFLGVWIFFCYTLLMATILYYFHKRYIFFFKNSICNMMENEIR